MFGARPESELGFGELQSLVRVDVVDGQSSVPIEGVKADGGLHGPEAANHLVGRPQGEGAIGGATASFEVDLHVDHELGEMLLVVDVVGVETMGPGGVVGGGGGHNGRAVVNGPSVLPTRRGILYELVRVGDGEVEFTGIGSADGRDDLGQQGAIGDDVDPGSCGFDLAVLVPGHHRDGLFAFHPELHVALSSWSPVDVDGGVGRRDIDRESKRLTDACFVRSSVDLTGRELG